MAMSGKVREFRSLGQRFKRAVNSDLYVYWERHEAENRDGWSTACRQYPYKKSAEAAMERVDGNEGYVQRMLDLYEEATEDEQDEMNAIEDQLDIFVVRC